VEPATQYFTRNWYAGDDDADRTITVEAYWRHVDAIADRLPPTVRTFAREVNLHDGRFRAVTFTPSTGVLEMKLRCGDLQVGYFDLNLKYIGVHLPDTALAQLIAPVNNPTAEILYDEIDLGDDGRLVHRLALWPATDRALWPFTEVVISFITLDYVQRPRPTRRFGARLPRFHLSPADA
jgi:hypothetical protein